jgi:hypothetical protein
MFHRILQNFFGKKLVKLEFDFSFETVFNETAKNYGFQNIPNWFMNYKNALYK